MRQLPSGVSNYVLGGSFTQTIKDGASVSLSGSSQLRIEVDFGSRHIGGGSSTLTVNSTSGGGNINSTLSIASVDFSTSSGNAQNIPLSGSVSPLGTFSGTTVTFQNAAGIVAQHLDASIQFDNELTSTAHNAGSGSIDNAPKVSGGL